jgi:hypothetical protein
LQRKFLAKPGVLNRNGERGRNLERDIAVLGIECRGGARNQADFTNDLALYQKRDGENAANPFSQQLVVRRWRVLHGGKVFDISDSAASERVARAEITQANR